MSWTLRVPYRDRADDLADVALASRAIADPEERAVAYQLAVDAAPSGAVTSMGRVRDAFLLITTPRRSSAQGKPPPHRQEHA